MPKKQSFLIFTSSRMYQHKRLLYHLTASREQSFHLFVGTGNGLYLETGEMRSTGPFSLLVFSHMVRMKETGGLFPLGSSLLHPAITSSPSGQKHSPLRHMPFILLHHCHPSRSLSSDQAQISSLIQNRLCHRIQASSSSRALRGFGSL